MKDTKPMNVYQKIQDVRCKLADLKLRKSGENKALKFTYYELSDFLPKLNELMRDTGLMTRFSMDDTAASLMIFNSDFPEESVNFVSPVADVHLRGGAEPIQNLGGKITYMRRYLLMVAFEIVETDVVDAQKQESPLTLDEASIKRINSAKDKDELTQVCTEIKNIKGVKYQNLLVKLYNEKKAELETITSIQVAEDASKAL